MRLLITLLAALLLTGCGSPVGRGLAPNTKGPSAPVQTDMEVSIPRLGIEGINAETARFDDESALRQGLMHVSGTGFPWQPGANVYLAGHDLGYPATPSWRVFWNLRDLRDGDRIHIDADGKHYTYRVYTEFVVGPDATRVLAPVGKSVVTLQTCVPHWSWDKRLIVRGELMEATRGTNAQTN